MKWTKGFSGRTTEPSAADERGAMAGPPVSITNNMTRSPRFDQVRLDARKRQRLGASLLR